MSVLEVTNKIRTYAEALSFMEGLRASIEAKETYTLRAWGAGGAASLDVPEDSILRDILAGAFCDALGAVSGELEVAINNAGKNIAVAVETSAAARLDDVSVRVGKTLGAE